MGSRRNPRVSNGSRRRAIRRYWQAQQLPCQICGGDIDYALPAGHPLSFEVDEKVPVSMGGDPCSIENTGPAHRVCNQRKGAMTLEAARARLRRKPVLRSFVRTGGAWS